MVKSQDYQRWQFQSPLPSGKILQDYVIHDIQAGEWRNYTRIFPQGAYEVSLRQSFIGGVRSEAVLERVTTDVETNTVTALLGFFTTSDTGFLFRNIPLTDGRGNKVLVQLDGKQTLRVRQTSQVSDESKVYQNYLVFIPRPAPMLVVESAGEVSGPYEVDRSFTFDPIAHSFTGDRLDRPSRFYRLRSGELLRIQNLTLTSSKVIIDLSQ